MGADLIDIQLISKFNKGNHFLLCVIDIVSKYAWDIPLKNKKGTTARFKIDQWNHDHKKIS